METFQEETPLFLAALEGKFNAVKLLISLGASKDICDQKERSPRDVAAERKYQEIVSFLDTVSSQRGLALTTSRNSISFGGQLLRQKKTNKKSNQVSGVKMPCNFSPATFSLTKRLRKSCFFRKLVKKWYRQFSPRVGWFTQRQTL